MNEELRYRGYRLDSGRVPIFRYTFGDVMVEESLRPTEDGTALVHRHTFTGPEGTIFLRLGLCDVVERPGQVYKFEDYMIALKETPRAQAGPSEVGRVLPVAVTEAGTTVEQVITWR